MMPRVFLCSPFTASTKQGIAENIVFARKCMADCLKKGEAPFASHLLYTQPGVLNDHIPTEREAGMAAGNRFLHVCDRVVAYIDRGVSNGMRRKLRLGLETATPIEFRRLDGKRLPTPRWLHDNKVPHEECSICYEAIEVLYEPILPTVKVSAR